MKNLLIKTMNGLANVSFAVLILICILSVIGGGIVETAIIFAIGLIALTLVFGFWAVVTNILEQQKLTNKLLKEMLDKAKEQSHSSPQLIGAIFMKNDYRSLPEKAIDRLLRKRMDFETAYQESLISLETYELLLYEWEKSYTNAQKRLRRLEEKAGLIKDSEPSEEHNYSFMSSIKDKISSSVVGKELLQSYRFWRAVRKRLVKVFRK